MAPISFDAFWNEPVDGIADRVTGDPLGLRAWAGRVAAELVPGLRNGTNRVQGFGLVCAGVRRAHRQGVVDRQRDGAFLRMERAWVLAQASRQASGWAGDRRARALVKRDNDDKKIDLDEPLLSRQLLAGIWGMYRRAAAALGLLVQARPDRGASPSQVRLTDAGAAVAEAWWRENVYQSEERALRHRLTTGRITVEQLQHTFKVDTPPYDFLAAALTEAARDVEGPSGPLTRLREVWDSSRGDLSPIVLQRERSLLTQGQQHVVDQAAAVVHLTEQLELPYRRHILGLDPKPPPARLANDQAWQAVPAHEREVHELHHALASTPRSWDGVQRWARTLAERRGSPPPGTGAMPHGYDKAEPPALSLLAADSLFSQGLLGPAREAKDAKARMRAAANAEDGTVA